MQLAPPGGTKVSDSPTKQDSTEAIQAHFSIDTLEVSTMTTHAETIVLSLIDCPPILERGTCYVDKMLAKDYLYCVQVYSIDGVASSKLTSTGY